MDIGEILEECLLRMVAMDGSNVGIKIQDQNDNAPEFDQAEYEMIFLPTSSAVSLVGRVTGRDSDGPAEGVLGVLQHRLQLRRDHL